MPINIYVHFCTSPEQPPYRCAITKNKERSPNSVFGAARLKTVSTTRRDPREREIRRHVWGTLLPQFPRVVAPRRHAYLNTYIVDLFYSEVARFAVVCLNAKREVRLSRNWLMRHLVKIDRKRYDIIVQTGCPPNACRGNLLEDGTLGVQEGDGDNHSSSLGTGQRTQIAIQTPCALAICTSSIITVSGFVILRARKMSVFGVET